MIIDMESGEAKDCCSEGPSFNSLQSEGYFFSHLDSQEGSGAQPDCCSVVTVGLSLASNWRHVNLCLANRFRMSGSITPLIHTLSVSIYLPTSRLICVTPIGSKAS